LVYVGYLDVEYLKSVVGNAHERDVNFITSIIPWFFCWYERQEISR